MRALLIPLLLFGFLTCALGDDAALIPSALNSVLPQIQPGMKKEEVARLLAGGYPKLESRGAVLWSGQTGYVGFTLDERYSLHVAAEFDSKREEIVHRNLLFYVFDDAKKLRVEIRQFSWDADEKKRANQAPEPTR